MDRTGNMVYVGDDRFSKYVRGFLPLGDGHETCVHHERVHRHRVAVARFFQLVRLHGPTFPTDP